jgi:phosphatidylethanolamine/phosphatidyl-N-methylethanolamine N-methyltransferase
MARLEHRYPTQWRAGTALFLKRWLRQPLSVGALVPSGRPLAEAIAKATRTAIASRTGCIVELGAGTGEVTRALLEAGIPAQRLALIERDPEMAKFLRRRFPALKIIEGDAARLPALLSQAGCGEVAAVVSSLPLLSMPGDIVSAIVRGVFKALPDGAALIQFTYGPKPPVPLALRSALHLGAAHGPRIWRNVPPAVVWTFRRAYTA